MLPFMEQRLDGLLSVFREKGATNPEKALTAEELGLPGIAKFFLRSRMGPDLPFIEVDGKFYLSEEKVPNFARFCQLDFYLFRRG